MIVTQGYGTASGGDVTKIYDSIDVSVSQVNNEILVQSEEVVVSVSESPDSVSVSTANNQVTVTEEEDNVEVS